MDCLKGILHRSIDIFVKTLQKSHARVEQLQRNLQIVTVYGILNNMKAVHEMLETVKKDLIQQTDSSHDVAGTFKKRIWHPIEVERGNKMF